jgi:hypothetical protein
VGDTEEADGADEEEEDEKEEAAEASMRKRELGNGLWEIQGNQCLVNKCIGDF